MTTLWFSWFSFPLDQVWKWLGIQSVWSFLNFQICVTKLWFWGKSVSKTCCIKISRKVIKDKLKMRNWVKQLKNEAQLLLGEFWPFLGKQLTMGWAKLEHGWQVSVDAGAVGAREFAALKGGGGSAKIKNGFIVAIFVKCKGVAIRKNLCG